MAKRLYPEDLMQRQLATYLTSIPKLFHQSWINDISPAKFEEWSSSCRAAHPDWEWVLWTDEDNRRLVERYAPWFIDTYEFLQSEIYRADATRNMYMHVFGGVYADLETECLLPYDTMFAKYNTSTLGHGGGQHLNSASAAGRLKKTPSDVSQAAERKVFVGRMGVDEKSADSIPNAWMASTPGHPFWLQPMEVAEEMAALRGMQPEQMTGPIALYDQIKRYNDDFEAGRGDGGIKLDEHYATSGWRHLYKSSSVKSLARARQSLVILPHYEVYPFSWQRDGDMFKQYCTSSGETFDAKKCKALLGLEHWGSHSITYWSHSWSGDGSGHWEEHLEAMNNSNDPEIEKETVEKKGDERKDHEKTDDKNRKERADATEANRKAEEAKKQGDDKKKAQERSTILISNGRGKRR